MRLQEKSERNSNIELFRLILMAFVIGCHVIAYNSFHPQNPLRIGTPNFALVAIFESFFIVAVNCFILISGYFQINVSRERAVKIYTQVLTYSVVISAVFAIYYYIVGGVIEKKELLYSMFPVLSKRWWFFTAYIILFLASPLLNLIIKQYSRRQLQFTICTMLVFFVISPSIGLTVLEGRGYNFVHFILLYFIGAYIKRYVVLAKVKIYLLCYLLFTVAIVAYTFFLDSIGRNAGYITASFAYNNILVVAASIFLFGVFITWKMKQNKLINSVSALVFGVYLFHEHPQVKNVIYSNLFYCKDYCQTGLFVPNMFLTIFVILTVGLGVEYLRVRFIAQPINNFFLTILNKVLPKDYEKKDVSGR